jgi:hypothetical protein
VVAIHIVVALAALRSSTPALAQSDHVAGVPWTGDEGITETVAQIMERERTAPISTEPAAPLAFCPAPTRSNLPVDPSSLLVSQWPPFDGQLPASAYTPRDPQVMSTSFLAATIAEAGVLVPDTMGDVSPSQVLVCLNGRFKVFDRSGTLGNLNVTADVFFSTVRAGNPTLFPRVVWDRLTNRWFIFMANSPASGANRILLAVSDSSGTITSGASFTFFQFQQDQVGSTPNSDTNGITDFPSLGVDANAVYIGSNIFNPLNSAFLGSTGWVIRKSDLLVNTLTVTAFRQLTTPAGQGPRSPRGVTNFDPAATEGYFIGQANNTLGQLVMRRISTPGGTPSISGNLNITVPATALPMQISVQDSTAQFNVYDDSCFDARIYKNRATGVQTLWTAHHIRTDSTGVGTSSGDRVSTRWYQIQNLTTTPTLAQSGTLFDTAASSPRNYIFPTCAMSAQGHMALGATGAGAAEHLECLIAGRLNTDPSGILQAATIAQSSTFAYNRVSPPFTVNFWGVYSSTIVDPADDMSIWTFQEYCNATNSWAVRVIKLLAPPPATPMSCSPGFLKRDISNRNIDLTGASLSGSGFFDPGPGFPNHLTAAVSGTGVTVNSVTYNDPTHITLNLTVSPSIPAGARTITITNPDGQSATSATGILTINNCGSADFNHDGDVGTDLDIAAFFSCLAGNCCALCDGTDFNGDGDIGTDLDIEAFFTVLAGGQC